MEVNFYLILLGSFKKTNKKTNLIAHPFATCRANNTRVLVLQPATALMMLTTGSSCDGGICLLVAVGESCVYSYT